MQNSEEKLSISPQKMQMASAVGPRARIQSVRLLNMSARLGEASTEGFKFIRNHRDSKFTRRDDNSLDVDIQFVLDLAKDEVDKSEPPISIKAEYRLTYKVEDLAEFDDDHLAAFTQVNGYFNAWPFWRELTTSMLARTQSGLFLLPTLRVQVPPDDEKAVTEAQ